MSKTSEFCQYVTPGKRCVARRGHGSTGHDLQPLRSKSVQIIMDQEAKLRWSEALTEDPTIGGRVVEAIDHEIAPPLDGSNQPITHLPWDPQCVRHEANRTYPEGAHTCPVCSQQPEYVPAQVRTAPTTPSQPRQEPPTSAGPVVELA